jgi:acyl-CoA thioesterase FadM
MIDRSHIGFTTEQTKVLIDPWRVRLFCQATGETDPVYWDADAAAVHGYRAYPVPPTFLKAMEGEHFSSAQLLNHLNVPVRGVLHAEQTFEYLASLSVGDAVEIRRQVVDIYDKKEGTLTFIVVDTHYSVSAQPVAISRQTILVRNSLKTP